jgi:hypothetical protein
MKREFSRNLLKNMAILGVSEQSGFLAGPPLTARIRCQSGFFWGKMRVSRTRSLGKQCLAILAN